MAEKGKPLTAFEAKKKIDSELDSDKTVMRALSAGEIAKLTEQGCSCPDWSKVRVAEGFEPARVKSTHFSGTVQLGVFQRELSFFGGVKKSAGITNAAIHNCRIGNNVYINHVRNHIANYRIEDDVIIENVELLAVDGQSSFGNGTAVAVVNEAGGREILIYDHLSAHIAYIMAFYRHRPGVIERLREMINAYAGSVASSMGLVAKAARLSNCRIIKNVRIGPASSIEAANRLENGSVNSCPEDPAYIGPGVCARDFICCSGSKITDGVIIERCFVGQGAVLAKQYCAEDSVFFANSECFQGEACSIFAGPYTVTHHKSTLLIAGFFSFLNAGSGSNQSNHMYKLGPVHQGLIERGTKTASDSYMLWPARVGAFSVVVARHYQRPDTSDFPFSYLTEHNSESILAPGTNLRRTGVVRDCKKWPKRDRRKDPCKPDLINFEMLNPYTVQKMLKGMEMLVNHKETTEKGTDFLGCPGVKVRYSAIDNGIKLYQMGIDEFLGNCLISRLGDGQFKSFDEVRAALSLQTNTGTGKWVDLAGLLAPQECVEKTLLDIESGSAGTLEQVTEAFRSMYDNYRVYEWAWAANVLQQRLGNAFRQVTVDEIIELLTNWKTAVKKLGSLRLADAQKEYTAAVRIGYGPDGDDQIRDADFERVRLSFEENSFVCEIQKDIADKTALANELISRLKRLC